MSQEGNGKRRWGTDRAQIVASEPGREVDHRGMGSREKTCPAPESPVLKKQAVWPMRMTGARREALDAG